MVNVGKDMGKLELLCVSCGNANGAALWQTIWSFLKKLKTELSFDLAVLPLGVFQKK